MRETVRAAATYVLMLALLQLAAVPASWSASPQGARLEGLVVGVDGRAASGLTVHLIDGEGAVVDRVPTSSDGLYSFQQVAPGDYWLGLEAGDGRAAPVAAPAVRLQGGELARRDVKLMQADSQRVAQATSPNYGVGMWWTGLSPAAKVWVVVGVVTFAGITYAALDDDDEPAASPMN